VEYVGKSEAPSSLHVTKARPDTKNFPDIVCIDGDVLVETVFSVMHVSRRIIPVDQDAQLGIHGSSTIGPFQQAGAAFVTPRAYNQEATQEWKTRFDAVQPPFAQDILQTPDAENAQTWARRDDEVQHVILFASGRVAVIPVKYRCI
jgi:hypothetical protein